MTQKFKNNDDNTYVYFILLDDYLKPKKPTGKLQLFNGSHIKKETQLQLKHLGSPILDGDKTKLREETQNNEKISELDTKISKGQKYDIKKKLKSVFSQFFSFLQFRQDDGLCRLKTGFEIYCEFASVHGFINFVNSNIWQRLFWSLVICFAVCMICYLTFISYLMNQKNPTVFYTEGIAFPTWTVPVPAVTICDINPISQMEAQKVANKFLLQSSLTRDEILQLFPLALYASQEVNGTDDDFMALNLLLERNNYTIAQLLYEISPKCNHDKKIFCRIVGRFDHCSRMISKVSTVVGVCCSQNFFGLRITKQNNEPLVSFSAGYEMGLTLLIEANQNNCSTSSRKFLGYTVYIHDAFDGIDGLSSKHFINARTETSIGVIPKSSYGTVHLRRMSVQSRYCYFPDERKLITFHKYSQKNCLIECRSLLMFEKCGCLPTFWPQLNSQWKYCQSAFEIKCVLAHKDIYYKMIVNDTEYRPRSHKRYNIICDCYPSCDVNQYTTIVESALLDRSFQAAPKRIFKGHDHFGNHILLHVFYEDLSAERYRLDASENWLTFLAYFGGIAGLYIGSSFVAGLEVIFFAFIRPLCNWLTKQTVKYRLKKKQKRTI